ncbi:hypothetical protein ABZX95_50550 [Streptomyces sp. NPDC004232]|uniref:hypothetical protein n=1 Tax=Streptomyces sp. NPDC004232 TaxID=3154454 RepID=UPI0033A4775B
MHSSTRSTWTGSTVASGRTGRKEHWAHSARVEVAAFDRGIDLGVKTTSGLRPPRVCCLTGWK